MLENKGVKYGLYGSLGMMIYTLALYLIDPTKFFGWFSLFNMFIGVVVVVVCMSMATSEEKSENKGILPFADALKTTFMVGVIVTITSMLFTFVLYEVIDNGSLLNLYKENQVEFLERFADRMDEDAFENAVEQIDETEKIVTSQFMTIGTVFFLIFYFIIAMIVSAIVKREPHPGA